MQGAPDIDAHNAGMITLQVPDAANVTFKNMIFGAGQMAMGVWTEPGVASMSVPHRIASVTFDGCTFNGNWRQDGSFGSDKMVIRNSTFNVHENTAYANNSNPIWISQMGHTNVTIDGCTINAVRPLKLWERDAEGDVSITNNTFNMSLCVLHNDINDTHKNIGIMFRTSTLHNVTITGNTLTGNATALFCCDDDAAPTVADDAVINTTGNTIPAGTELSVIYKSTTKWELKKNS